MDRIDYTFKFSTELIVLTLSLIVIVLNFAGPSTLRAFSKDNHFSKYLANHPEKNPLLYDRNTTTTVVVNDKNLIPTASANTIAPAIQETTTVEQNALIEDNAITRPNPDSTRSLVSDQIKVYDTVAGDTLESIANRFGVTVETIMWANNLTGKQIKPGWNLVILPTSGVLHKVAKGDSISSIAKKFTSDTTKIVSYNNLLDDDDIEIGQLLIVPDGKVPPPPAQTAPKTIRNVISGGRVVYSPVPEGITEFDEPAHRFPWGQCTYYVATRRKVPWSGHAKSWLVNASAYGATVGKTPIPGAIVVTNENRRYGHVAYVERVNGDEFTFTEMNYVGLGILSTRTMSINDPRVRGFIY